MVDAVDDRSGAAGYPESEPHDLGQVASAEILPEIDVGPGILLTHPA